MPYVLNPTGAQRSITARLREAYPHVPVIEGGMLDQDDDLIQKFSDGSIKPFIVVRHGSIRRSQRGRSIAFEKLDSHMGHSDIVVVARKEPECRELMNHIGDTMIGFKPVNAGGMVKGEAVWEPSIVSMESLERPTRWSANDRYYYGVQANHTV